LSRRSRIPSHQINEVADESINLRPRRLWRVCMMHTIRRDQCQWAARIWNIEQSLDPNPGDPNHLEVIYQDWRDTELGQLAELVSANLRESLAHLGCKSCTGHGMTPSRQRSSTESKAIGSPESRTDPT